ncbi:MAG: hypothetical protein HYZ57_06855 [Acidobacteria bacterium]|nr:hypothetical protein [Acidobacteriota bacterium]MBI3279542.1 hypothetical protein [Acidobacteriota bacterium]
MQSAPESYVSIPRRALDIEDYIDIIRRHKAWILGPMFGALVITVVLAFLWPDTYVSSAVIRVVPPQVPENYVPSNLNMEMSQRINSMAQTILSRGVLTNIVNTFNLYARERQRKPMEDVVEDMRRDIKIGNVVSLTTQGQRGVSAFSISFSYDNRIMAQKVTADLVSRFMSENTRDRTTQSVLTTQFLKDQVEAAKKELDTVEDKLARIRQENAGRLPDQIQNNWAQLSALENRVANLNGAISRTNQEKLVLESELRTIKNQLAALKPPTDQTVMSQKSERLERIDREVQNLENQLNVLREHYRDTYPDVQRVQSLLKVARQRREQVAKEEAEKGTESAPPSPVMARLGMQYERDKQTYEGQIQRVEALIRQRVMQAEDLGKELRSVESQIKTVQARIAQTPIGEQQYSEVLRDRELAKLKYEDLNKKRSQSQIAEELEKRQQGETLEVLDPASLPQSPIEPKRPLIIAIGAALGLVLGFCLAGAREAKDTSLKNLKDVRAYTQLTILGSVPLLENDLVVRRRKRLAWLAWSTACLVGIIIMTASVFYYYAFYATRM